MSTHHAATNSEYLYSTFGTDPDLGEIVELFVEEMPERIANLLDCASVSDRERLRVAAHQLKGAAGSYGFQPITDCAAQLEAQIRGDEPEEQIRQSVAALVEICQRARCKPQ